MDAPETPRARASDASESFERNFSQVEPSLRELLDAFHGEIATLIQEYSQALQSLVALVHDPRHWEIHRDREQDIARLFERLLRRFSLSPSELGRVLELLVDVHAARSQLPVSYAGYSGESAHMLAITVFGNAAELWRKCSETARRSQTEPGYLYPATSSQLFAKTWMKDHGAPPQELMSLCAIEHRNAVRELEKKTTQDAPLTAETILVTGNSVTVTAPNEDETESTPSVDLFPTPAGARWQDLAIRFSDRHTVLAGIGAIRRKLNYTQMGMNDRRNGSPDKQWELLQLFADGSGLLTWQNADASDKLQKRKEILSANLKRVFKINGEPFKLEGGGWRTIFTIEPDA